MRPHEVKLFAGSKGGTMNLSEIEKHLGAQAKDLLGYKCKGISKDMLHIPGSDWVDRIFAPTDRKSVV